ncbi:hypothetical protein FRC06_004344 [Ceratobasidium sp. 370]|nr:hypothetical protein FRC06_004344 [Ceratobasidium sp. 370]
MPSRAATLNLQVLVHATATDFLDATEHILEKHDLTSNIIYPFAIKARNYERLPVSAAKGAAYWSAPRPAMSRPSRQFWITQWTVRSAATAPTLDFVVAVTDGQFGGYPVFIWSPHASFSFCTAKTLLPAPTPIAGHSLRLATRADLDQCAQLCKEFADDSVYFPLSLSDGRLQAETMIDAKQLWVYDTPQGIATIVASTRRTTDAVASINKVYTPPAHRGKGCAQRLVAHVTRALLSGTEGSTKHRAVVLYVGHDNSAARVYHRVGYQGLAEGAPRPREVENWLEIGFQGTDRGHW